MTEVKKKKPLLNFQVTEEEKKEIQELAKADGRSISNYIRKALGL